MSIVEKHGNTPIYHAIEGGNDKIVEELLHSRAKTNLTNSDKETPLSLAKRLKRIKILKRLEYAEER